MKLLDDNNIVIIWKIINKDISLNVEWILKFNNYADRLEYSLSNDLIVFKTNTLEDIREIYNDIEVQTNENEIIELGFKTKKIARQFVKNTSRLSVAYRDDATRFYMQAIADILKKVSEDGLINKIDLVLR